MLFGGTARGAVWSFKFPLTMPVDGKPTWEANSDLSKEVKIYNEILILFRNGFDSSFAVLIYTI
jgi:hypothetical protein